MAKVHITQELVYSACNQILAAREIPTKTRIRKIIGTDGSDSTIQKHLELWREQHDDDLKKLKPEERGKIPEHFMPLITTAFHKMSDLIEDELCNDRITQLEKRNQELLDQIEELEMNIERLEKLEAEFKGFKEGYINQQKTSSKAELVMAKLMENPAFKSVFENTLKEIEAS